MDYGTYCSLAELKAELEITDTASDAVLLRHLVKASRKINDLCGRHFYAKTDTRYYTGNPNKPTELSIDDLLAVTTLQTDADFDGTYENTLAASDYILTPVNKYPKTVVVLDTLNGNYTYWPHGRGNDVLITGSFGHGDGQRASPWDDSGATATVATAAGTSVTASSGTPFSAGQTILVESEQMYISAVASTTLTVVRGVNGTTAAAHSAKSAYIAAYPAQVVRATVVLAGNAWKRREGGYGALYGSPEFGSVRILTGNDPEVREMLGIYGQGQL